MTMPKPKPLQATRPQTSFSHIRGRASSRAERSLLFAYPLDQGSNHSTSSCSKSRREELIAIIDSALAIVADDFDGYGADGYGSDGVAAARRS
jgi:hypothetical protein